MPQARFLKRDREEISVVKPRFKKFERNKTQPQFRIGESELKILQGLANDGVKVFPSFTIDKMFLFCKIIIYKRLSQPQGSLRFLFMSTILFIDGENFVKKLQAVLKQEEQPKVEPYLYDFKGLLDKILQEIEIDKKLFYFARLKEHLETREKSRQLIEVQRRLKQHLEQQGFTVILSGRVRGQIERTLQGEDVLVFKEKGVDVKIAVDMVKDACDGKLKIAIIGSSDSDLQPAIAELKNRNVERIYLGFEDSPNKGLTFTTNRTILIRNSEVLEFIPKTLV